MNEKPTILVVDDEPANIFLFEGILEKEGFRVVSASTGEEALDKVKKDPPDLILTDLLMPRLHGYNLLQELKADDASKHIPVIIATAVYKGPLNRIESKQLGAAESLEKPVEPDLLVQTIKKALSSQDEQLDDE